MYFVDQKKIEQLLTYIDKLLALFDNERPFQSEVKHLALERLAHVLIESILDVCNMMIDGFIMRDPGGYHDIIHIMVDENVLSETDKSGYLNVIDLRHSLMQHYTQVNHEELESVLGNNREILARFSSDIHKYLDDESGVANAFLNT